VDKSKELDLAYMVIRDLTSPKKTRGCHAKITNVFEQRFSDSLCYLRVKVFHDYMGMSWRRAYEKVGDQMSLTASAVKKAYFRARSDFVETDHNGKHTVKFSVTKDVEIDFSDWWDSMDEAFRDAIALMAKNHRRGVVVEEFVEENGSRFQVQAL
jgi:hypothetical protein